MIYRTGRILLEIVGIGIGGLLVLAALAIWRLSAAPVEAQFIRPYLEQAVNDANLGFEVQLTGAKIDWQHFRPRLDLHFLGVRVSGERGATVGGFQDGTLGLSIRNLIFGRPAVVAIEIRRPEIRVVRDQTGAFSLRLGSGTVGDDPANGGTDFKALADRILAPPGDSGSLGQLRRVRIADGRVVIEDRKLGLSWSAPRLDLDIVRMANGMTARLDLDLALPGHPARLTGEARYEATQGHTGLALNVSGFDAAVAAPLATVLGPLKALSMPLDGHVEAVIDRQGAVLGVQASLQGERGQLILPDFYAQPLEIRKLGLDAHFNGAPERLVLDRLAVDLGDAQLSARGVSSVTDDKISIDSQVDLAAVPLARFDALWPHGFAVGGRDWVTEHITDGVVKSGSVHLTASGPATDPAAIEVADLRGVFDFSGLEVHYFPPLMPAKAIAGHATFDTRGMQLSLESGALGDIALSAGDIVLTGFDRDDRDIDIALTLAGPLKTALAVLDSPPLGYAHELGIVPAEAGGRLDVRAKFAFPLIKSLEFKQVSLGVTGTLDGVSAKAVVGPRDLSDGALTIQLDKKSMHLNGAARLSGVPATLDWREAFETTNPVRSRITFKSLMGDADRTALDLPLPDAVALSGPVGVDGVVSIDRKRRISLAVDADLSRASLQIGQLALDKPASAAGRMRFTIDFLGDAVQRMSDLRLDAKGVEIAGSAAFAPDGAFRRAEMTRVLTPRNEFTATVDREPGLPRAFAIAVKGLRLDASPFLRTTGPETPNPDPPRLDIIADLRHLATGPDSGFDDVDASLTLSGGRLERGHVKARAGRSVVFDYTPAGDSIGLSIDAEDAGATLAGLGLTRGVRGGILRLEGHTDLKARDRLTSAVLDIRDFRLTDAPIAARLLNAISPTGFVDLLAGQGLAFDRLSAQMDYGVGKLAFRNGRSAGALGISFEGDVDLRQDKVALKGTVVPVDTFNRILRSIPVIGDVLTGGSRGGLIGWTYTVAGSTDDPKVSVNPLSMFAPGFLRNLFFLGPTEPKPEPQAPAER